MPLKYLCSVRRLSAIAGRRQPHQSGAEREKVFVGMQRGWLVGRMESNDAGAAAIFRFRLWAGLHTLSSTDAASELRRTIWRLWPTGCHSAVPGSRRLWAQSHLPWRRICSQQLLRTAAIPGRSTCLSSSPAQLPGSAAAPSSPSPFRSSARFESSIASVAPGALSVWNLR